MQLNYKNGLKQIMVPSKLEDIKYSGSLFVTDMLWKGDIQN